MIASCPAPAQEALLRITLPEEWEMAVTKDARDPDHLGDLRFIAARIPGTAASALRTAGIWRPGLGRSLDQEEYWFRCRFEAQPAARDEEVLLEIGGIATLSEAWLNGTRILTSESMFAAHRVNVSGILRERNELLIVCRSLSAALRARRGQQPAARWRTRVASEQQLRWFRTTLLGRAPGFAPEPAPVGPWRPVTMLRRKQVAVEHWRREATLEGSTGIVRIGFQFRPLASVHPAAAWLHCGEWSAPVEWSGDGRGQAELRIPEARPWFPHTHGEPALYPARLELQFSDGTGAALDDVPVGFRSVEFNDGRLKINGGAVFCRGVVWTPADPIGFSETTLGERLRLLRDGGFNLIRLAGTMTYESEAFHGFCDELGLLVWQDLMYANMDYPFADPSFREIACREAQDELSRISRHASTAFLCGNSEIEQQAGMLGLDSEMGRGPFFGEELPRIAGDCCPGIPYIPSAPSGGDLPFRTRAGAANYFGVGAYLRPIEDVRRAEVRFASECLAFANVPEPELIEKMALATPGGISPVHPVWKRGVSRDAGVGWDFEDVRDHYLKLLYGIDPALRYSDMQRYWELSRLVTGELMAEVFGEWRRAGATCGGGIVLWSADLEPGAGWGILDCEGRPKSSYWFLKRALSPIAIWTTDEGLNGIDIHAANDTAQAVDAWLRVALYKNGEHKIEEAQRAISLRPQSGATFGVEEILGKFVDASYSYRFGPPAHNLIAASLHLERGEAPFAQAFRLPAGRSTERVPISDLGLAARAAIQEDGSIDVRLSSRRFANGVRVISANTIASDSYFGIEPGVESRVTLRPLHGQRPGSLFITAANAEGRYSVSLKGAE